MAAFFFDHARGWFIYKNTLLSRVVLYFGNSNPPNSTTVQNEGRIEPTATGESAQIWIQKAAIHHICGCVYHHCVCLSRGSWNFENDGWVFVGIRLAIWHRCFCASYGIRYVFQIQHSFLVYNAYKIVFDTFTVDDVVRNWGIKCCYDTVILVHNWGIHTEFPYMSCNRMKARLWVSSLVPWTYGVEWAMQSSHLIKWNRIDWLMKRVESAVTEVFPMFFWTFLANMLLYISIIL